MDPSILRRSYETADFEALRSAYADDAVFDASVPGRRVRLTGPDAIVAQLSSWWPEPGDLLRWSVDEFPGGLIVEFERTVDGGAWRQRQFLSCADGKVVRQLVYSGRPQTAGALAPLPPDLDVVEREPLTHHGQSGNAVERVRLRDGTRLVLKHLRPEGDWLAQGTRDDFRELRFFHDGVYERVPRPVDHTVVGAYARTLVMRDVSDTVVTRERRLTRDESRRVLGAAAALHAEFDGEDVAGACTLADRISFCGPEAMRPWSLGDDFIPKAMCVGWEVFEETVPRAVADAVFAVHAAPGALASELLATGRTLVHADLRWANLGFAGERLVFLDWGTATTAPPAIEFSWYLFVNGRRIDATYDDLLADFRALEGEPPRGTWLAQLCIHGGILAHELIEPDDAKREVARRELAWWCERAGEAL